jgi:hypothetical protein
MPKKIDYLSLNSRQKENHNFQKASGILADYGFTPIRLSDDWNGADFIAQHADGKRVLRVQLKGRLDVRKKNEGKKLWLCFPGSDGWYLCPNNSVLNHMKKSKKWRASGSWSKRGGYGWPRLPNHLGKFLKRFLLH